MTDLEALWVRLAQADADANADELGRIAWQLYASLGQAQSSEAQLRACVHELVRKAGQIQHTSHASSSW